MTVSISRDLLFVLGIYLASRCLLLLAAYLQSAFGHHDFLHELSNWDGLWYREVANHGYLDHVSFAQTTLGFFPLFPLAIWLVEPVIMVLTGQDSIWAASVAGAGAIALAGAVPAVVCSPVNSLTRSALPAIIGFSGVMREELFGPLAPKYGEYAGLINESR